MWQCIEYTRDVDGVTKKRYVDILFWSMDESKMIHQVKVPKGCMPVHKTGRA